MNDTNKMLLDDVLTDTLNYVKENPGNDDAVEKLEMLLKASTEQYKATVADWNEQERISNEAQLKEKELQLREKELEEQKRWHRGDIAAKLVGTAAATGCAILACKWESVGEFVHNIVFKIGPKFRS